MIYITVIPPWKYSFDKKDFGKRRALAVDLG